MTANNKKSYFGYLNKLLYKYNNAYHHSIGKKPINGYYSVLTEEMEANLKSSKVKVGNRFIITKCKNTFSKDYIKNWSKEIFVINSMLKTNPWTCNINDMNRKAIKVSFYEKNNCCWVNCKWVINQK